MKWRWFQRNQNSEDALYGFRTRLMAQFCPTPWAVVRQMLELAEVRAEDVVYDLGSGDGRIPILAAQEFGCRAVGIERDPDLFLQSSKKVQDLELADRVLFLNQDFFQADLRPATVVTLYLLSAVNGQLQERMASHLRAGSRVVALDYGVPGWQAERYAPVKSEGNVDYMLHLYRRVSPGAMWGKQGTNGQGGTEERSSLASEGASFPVS
jgi:SAM-dependent methyltransferase